MASFKKVNIWQVIGSIWTAFWLLVVIRITIADYPWGTPIWKAMYWDASGFFHELEAILLLFAIGMLFIWISYLVSQWNKMLRGFLLIWEKRG
jgi:hypothetical protein